jgi:hypothetical protein
MRWLVVFIAVACLSVPARAAAVQWQATAFAAQILLAQTDSTVVREPLQIESDNLKIKAEIAAVGTPQIPGLRQWQRKKNTRVALFSSMILPGTGQVYNGRRWKTVIAVGISTFLVANIVIEGKLATFYLNERDEFADDTSSFEYREADALYNFHKDSQDDFIWWFGAAWLLTALDSWIDAHLFDVRSVDPSLISGSNRDTYVGLRYRF